MRRGWASRQDVRWLDCASSLPPRDAHSDAAIIGRAIMCNKVRVYYTVYVVGARLLQCLLRSNVREDALNRTECMAWRPTAGAGFVLRVDNLQRQGRRRCVN